MSFDVFEERNVVKVHIRRAKGGREDLFLISINNDGTYSWDVYAKNILNIDDSPNPYYEWMDGTSAEFTTLAETIHDCDQY